MVITLVGNNFLVDGALLDIRKDFVKEHGDFAIESLDAQEHEFQSIYDSIKNVPFLSPKKLTIIKQPSANNEFVKKVEYLINDLPESNDVVLVEPAIDKRSVFFKTLKQFSEVREYEELSGNELVRWIQDYAINNKGKISSSDALYLINLTGNNQIKLGNEIQKLIAYDPSISRESIDILVEPIPQSTVFQLLDSVFNSNVKLALEIYDDQRKQRIEPQQIIAMLAWQLHILAVIKAAGEMSANDIAKKAGINPFVVRKSLGIANKISLSELKDIIDQVIQLDIKSKTKMIDVDQAMKQLFISIAYSIE